MINRMEFLQTPFEYNIQSLLSTESSIFFGMVSLGIWVGIFFGMILLEKKIESIKKNIANKKKRESLQNMILMKSIQEEMDIEMKEALIRSELRSKK